MQFLEHRVPPPLVLLITLLLMRALATIGPAITMDFTLRLTVGVLLAILGIGIAASGVRTFRHAQTTINPLAPDKASALVTNGVFTLSRNPMYLGMLLLGLGWAVYLGSVVSLFGLVLFVLYLNRFQIVPEEAALADLFDTEYHGYCQRVRRWI